MASKKKIFNIVLIGKTGNGKSATGNTILGRTTFTESFSQSSVTKDCQLESVRFDDDIQINVVDTPGLEDTGTSKEEILKKLLDVMSLCPDGVDAFLIVLNSSTRFTQEEFDAFKTVSEFFGEDFLQVCTVVFTHGDEFEQKAKVPFKDWLEISKFNVNLKHLLEKCTNGCLLVNNENDFHLNKILFVDNLLNKITVKNIRYTHINFKNAAKCRQMLMMKSKLPQLKAKYQKQISLINAELEEAKKKIDFLNDDDILKIKEKIDELLELIASDDNQTEVLKNFKEEVTRLRLVLNGLKDKKTALKKIEKMREYTELLKNPPTKRGVVFSYLAFQLSGYNLKVATIFTMKFPFCDDLKKAATNINTLMVTNFVIEAKAYTQYYESKKRLEEELEKM